MTNHAIVLVKQQQENEVLKQQVEKHAVVLVEQQQQINCLLQIKPITKQPQGSDPEVYHYRHSVMGWT